MALMYVAWSIAVCASADDLFAQLSLPPSDTKHVLQSIGGSSGLGIYLTLTTNFTDRIFQTISNYELISSERITLVDFGCGYAR